jgi:C1A family cysteine protease
METENQNYNVIRQKTGTFLLNIEPSPIDTRDFRAEAIYADDVQIPEELDLRSFLHPVINQGAQGTCSAQVAACMKEYQEFKLQNLQGVDGKMSPQFVYNLREDIDSQGMTPRETMKILNKQGICREAIYNYGTIENPTSMPYDAYQDALNFQIEAYAQIDTVDGLKKALAKDGVCYICFPVYNEGTRFWKPAQGDKDLGGHAVSVVGYNSKGFILRNSWGKEWGDQGYTIYPYEDFGAHWEIWTTIDKSSAWPNFDANEYKQPIKASSLLYVGAAILLIFVYATAGKG